MNGKPTNQAARFCFAVWSLLDKRPQLSAKSASTWIGLRYGDMPGPDNRTTAQRLADSRYNPFASEVD